MKLVCNRIILTITNWIYGIMHIVSGDSMKACHAPVSKIL